MKHISSLLWKRVRLLALGTIVGGAMLLSACETVVVQTYHTDPAARARLDSLRTTDKAELRRRWGDIAELADKSWLHMPENGHPFGMDFRWVVPGAVLDVAFAHCNKSNCRYRWTVQYNPEKRQLDFVTSGGSLEKSLVVQEDGPAHALGGAEKWSYDQGSNTFKLTGAFASYQYRPVSRQQLVAAISVLGIPASGEQPGHGGAPVQHAAMDHLKTSDVAEIRRRWGDLANMVGKTWVLNYEHGAFHFWDARWKVPGTIIEMKTGGCKYGSCAMQTISMQHRPGTRTFDFVVNEGALRYLGNVNGDGSVHVETPLLHQRYNFKYIPSNNTVRFLDRYFREGTRKEVVAATGLVLPEPLAAAAVPNTASSSASAALQPVATAQAETPLKNAQDFADHFTLIAPPATAKGKITLAKGIGKPVIYVVDAKAGQKLTLTATSSRFNPAISVYRAADRTKIGARAGVSPLTMELAAKDSGPYLIAVYSADSSKGGDFSLNVAPLSQGGAVQQGNRR